MNLMHKHGIEAEARPVAHESAHHASTLAKVVVASKHRDGHSKVHLTPNQALYSQSRLSAIKVAFLDGHPQSVHHLGIEHLPGDHADHLSNCGAKVWPIISDETSAHPKLEEVVIESQHPDGYGLVHLTPDEARHIEQQLKEITLDFLHENIWGGEDARRQ